MKKWMKAVLIGVVVFALVAGIAAIVCIGHYVGFPEPAGEEKTGYRTETLCVEHDGISLYGKVLIPDGDGPFPTVIYAHGAESDYKADMTTLKSLAMSGVACYTFDFYGWTDRSTGPQGVHWFHDVPRGVDDSYEKKVLQQVEDLNAVIEAAKGWGFVDTNRLYLVGSSMGGATVATAAVTHSDDIRGIVLEYPAINLNPDAMVSGAPLDVNGYTGPVLILQGTKDVIVPMEMSQNLATHYNTLRDDHAELVIYEGQPHVFTGKYKVLAAKEIYRFLEENAS